MKIKNQIPDFQNIFIFDIYLNRLFKMENPSKKILLLPGENKRNKYFKSIIYKQLLKEETTTTEDEEQKISKLLKNLLICCIYYNYLDNPVYIMHATHALRIISEIQYGVQGKFNSWYLFIN